jgi:hypothetical protein
MSYEDWKAELIKVTAEETGRPASEIKINDAGAKEWYNSGVPPYFTFRENYAVED